MTAVLSLLVVLGFSFLVTRLFTAALSLTGLSKPLARLQAVSAFTGVGFTTSEAEHIVNHPVRRRLLIALMILGNAGVVTAISTLVLSFIDVQSGDVWMRSALLLGGVAVLVLIAQSRWIDVRLHSVIEWGLRRWTRLEALDVLDLMDLQGDYRVRQMVVDDDDWVAGRHLDELELFREGVWVLGIHRENDYLGVPRGETEVCAGDLLVLYGHADDLTELDRRKAGRQGDEAHDEAVRAKNRQREEQQAEEGMRRAAYG